MSMRTPSHLALGATLAAWVAVGSLVAGQAPATGGSIDPMTVTYAASDENFANPERGFYRQFLAFDLGSVRRPLSAGSLRSLRDEGISIIRVYFVIDEFRDGPISRDALDEIAADLTEVRQAGVKIIPRFAYSFPCLGSSAPCTDARVNAEAIDPPLSRVLEHIDQLTPTLRASSDVIAFMEMGFAGAWGEWHHSSTNLVNGDGTVNARSAAIVERVMFALPRNRMAVLRYPYHKQALFDAVALDEGEAFSGTMRSRIGAHNDCFLASADDFGTYSPPFLGPLEKNIQALKQFLSLDNRFVPQGGETCSADAPAQPYISCANALNDLATMHWSALNGEYQSQVLNLWRQQGCFPDVQRRLGYRFRLLQADIPSQVTAGLSLSLRFVMTNDGFAAPFNPREMELLLRHAVSGRISTIPIAADLRFWGAGETRVVEVRDVVPVGLDAGPYDALLNFPDPETGLRGRPEYSIRLANEGVWEPTTGYNRLQARILVIN